MEWNYKFNVPFLEFGPDIKSHYSPKNITFNDALDQYSILFNDIINKKSKGKKIILPISGGLDSRTIAAALKDHNNVIVNDISLLFNMFLHYSASRADFRKYAFLEIHRETAF